eukprot:CAMPEP_0194316202 /NCGR_PEP_ID=MMETSP0171-20130528/13020_1 /TAXON_ID=218684 /ORGANISM="Corethron pennatum, Strain L29A3" /LENGTH=168 /DNA_ID=CAMNT_0039072361 /DNA_START=60 /DNA_END=563 /DNA_ORIENTATION=+
MPLLVRFFVFDEMSADPPLAAPAVMRHHNMSPPPSGVATLHASRSAAPYSRPAVPVKAQSSHLLRLAAEHGSVSGAWASISSRHAMYNTVDFPIGWDNEDEPGVEFLDVSGEIQPKEMERYLNEIGFHDAVRSRLADAYGLGPEALEPGGLEYLDLFCVRYGAGEDAA